MTVTPPTVPTTSWRRRTPRNSASAAAPSSQPTPTSRATRRTPSALRALIAPGGWSVSRQTARPPSRTVKRVAPSSVKSVTHHSFASPRPKRRTWARVPRVTSRTCGKSPPRITPGPLEHPGEHRRRGRLAVRARNHERRAAGEEHLLHGRRHGEHAEPAGLRRLRLGVRAPDRVAAHHEVDAFEAGRVVALEDRDAELLEERAGRRVDVLVGAR